MPALLLDLPVEIVLLIVRELCSGDIISLLETSPCLNILLAHALIDNVCRDPESTRAEKALYSAAELRNRSVTQQLLDRGVFGGLLQRRRLLHQAVSGKKEDIAQTLLECGLDPEARDEDGWTCLALAAATGKEKIIRMLLERDDVDVNARVGEGLTPLTAAIRGGKADIVKVFLDHPRTDVYVRTTSLRSPFHVAIENREAGCKSTIELLLADERLDPNLVDSDRNTALHLSLRMPRHPATRPLLKSSRVKRSVPNAKGYTPLHNAIACRDRRVVYYMLRYCPRLRLNSGDLTHGTPLHVAAMRGDINIVRALLRKRSVNVNSQDSHGDTPLHYAAKGKHKGVAKLLLERGADFRVKNYDGNSVATLSGTYVPTIRRIVERYL